MSRSQVVILGSGTPNAEADRAGAGIAIAVDDVPYLVDCGHSVVQRVVQAHAAGKIAWDSVSLRHLFVTHLHADHTVGLPDLLYTPWIQGRAQPLQAYGPAGLADMAKHLQRAYQENIREHLSAHPASAAGYQLRAHAVGAAPVYQDARIQVEALPADHGDLEAYSYKFTTPDGVIVHSGDTKPVPAFADWARGCDILLHEVYSSARFPQRERAWQRYHARVHTSSAELAALARRVRPRLLVLIHQLFWGQSPRQLCAEIQASYAGAVVSAKDFDIFDL